MFGWIVSLFKSKTQASLEARQRDQWHRSTEECARQQRLLNAQAQQRKSTPRPSDICFAPSALPNVQPDDWSTSLLNPLNILSPLSPMNPINQSWSDPSPSHSDSCSASDSGGSYDSSNSYDSGSPSCDSSSSSDSGSFSTGGDF